MRKHTACFLLFVLVIEALSNSSRAGEVTFGEAFSMRLPWKEKASLLQYAGDRFPGNSHAAGLVMANTNVDVNGVLDVSVFFENRQVLPLWVYFPTHQRHLDSQCRPFMLAVYDGKKEIMLFDLLLTQGMSPGGHWHQRDWKSVGASELIGVNLRFSLQGEPNVKLSPGVYHMQAIFSKMIYRDFPQDKTVLSDHKNWLLRKKQDYDYFRSNTVRFVVSEHVADANDQENTAANLVSTPELQEQTRRVGFGLK